MVFALTHYCPHRTVLISTAMINLNHPGQKSSILSSSKTVSKTFFFLRKIRIENPLKG